MLRAPYRRSEPEAASGGARRRRRKVGVVLGAGAARGWAHIGALQEISAMGLKPDIIVGASIGALVGGCYAAGKLDVLDEFARSLTRRRVFSLLDLSFAGGGLFGGERLRTRLEGVLGGTMIEGLPVRFAGVATEIGSGHEIWLKRGPLVDAMRASYALPGVFEPVKIEGRWLFDGAIVNPVPVSVARALGAERVIALCVGSDGYGRGAAIPDPFSEEEAAEPAAPQETPERRGMMSRLWRGSAARTPDEGNAAPGLGSVMVNAFNITQDRIMRSRLAGDPPDALITIKVGRIGLFDFHRADELIAFGRESIRRASAEILEHLEAEQTEPATA